MKRFLLWQFERGSLQYDVICGIILAFILLTPPALFHDRPDYMRLSGEPVHQSVDGSGNTVFTVKVETPAFSGDQVNREAALNALRGSLGNDFTVSKMQPLYDTTGALIAYSIWIER
jgi:hypothetical protein